MPEDPTCWWATKPVHHNYIKNTVSRRVWDLASLEKCSIQPTGTMSWPPPSSGPGPPCVQWASSAAGLSKLAFRWLEPSFLQIQTNFLGPFINNWLRHSYPQISLNNNKLKTFWGDFPGGPVVKNWPCNAGNVDSIPGWATKSTHHSDWVHALWRPCATTRKSVHQRKILHDATKILSATTKTRCSQTNIFKKFLFHDLLEIISWEANVISNVAEQATCIEQNRLLFNQINCVINVDKDYVWNTLTIRTCWG